MGEEMKRCFLKRVRAEVPLRRTRTGLRHLEFTALSVLLEKSVRSLVACTSYCECAYLCLHGLRQLGGGMLLAQGEVHTSDE